LYQVLHGPAQAAESILQDAARMARPLRGMSQPALSGLDPGVPGLGSIGRFWRLWATAPRHVTPEVVSPLDGPTATGTAPGPPRPPRPVEEGYMALPNGTELVPPRGKKGFGEIKIVNLTEEEAAAQLAGELAPATALRLVYIRAGMEVTVRGIGPGVYYLSFRLGEEWLPTSRDFARRRARGGPVGPLPFFQFHSAEGVQADTYEIVLKPEALRH